MLEAATPSRTTAPNIERYPNATALARAAAQRFVLLADEAVTARGRFLVALAGGATPRATYALLATEEFASRVAWPMVHLFWGDERCVPPEHPDSNYRLVRESLLDHIPIPARNVHRIQGEIRPEQAAAIYQAELRASLDLAGRFDLILLGMGHDGHTASLFPGNPAIEEKKRSVVATYAKQVCAWRVTLTLPAINAAREVLFLVSGAAKAPALARVQGGEPLPAGLVQPRQGRLTWMVDQDAAGGLEG